ncbi:MAG: alpha/beta hydrolase [Pseudomonadota bacterium]
MLVVTGLVLLALLAGFALGPRPRLDAKLPQVAVPTLENPAELSAWLDERERNVPGMTPGAEACIQFADPQAPQKTPLCFVYVHGFSATWPETAPVTERLAARFGANVLQARLAGHGTDSAGMVTPAELWLSSLRETWEIATQLGDRVVIVATSTGAPLAVWLASFADVREKLHALLFMSPNFRIRSRFDFLLTFPWSGYWIHWFVGRERSWEPINEAQAKFWTYRYSTLALIEMQKVVAWARQCRLSALQVPLAIMYMKNDPTIDPAAAIRAFEQWGGAPKRLIKVTIDEDEASHVFVGDITAPHRNDWTVDQFATFLAEVRTP